MNIFDMVYLGTKSLTEVSTIVEDSEFDSVIDNVDKMFDTMHHYNGIGLAAPQVGINKRFIAIDIGSDIDENSGKYFMINPEIIEKSDETSEFEEGCLSLPTGRAKVTRPAEITVRWTDPNREVKTETFKGIMATCVQHEIDHLDGILFIDHVSKLKKSMVVKKVKKLID